MAVMVLAHPQASLVTALEVAAAAALEVLLVQGTVVVLGFIPELTDQGGLVMAIQGRLAVLD
jgi:hypothetical protein